MQNLPENRNPQSQTYSHQSDPPPPPRKNTKDKTGRGCWVVAGIGCVIVVISVGLIVAMFVGLIALTADMGGSVNEEVIYQGAEGKIAVVSIDGIITEASGTGGLLAVDGTSAEVVNNELSKAMNDDSVKGVILKMNTPGGEVVASDLILRKVEEVALEKPVVTWMSGMGASGGYLIATGSDTIIAHPSSITGSIGVILEISSMEGLYEKLGIENRIFKTGEFKDQEGIFDEDPDGEADAIMQALVDESYDDFVNAVAVGREMELSEVKELADGRIYSGIQAKENGLIDEIGYMEDAIDAVEALIGRSGLTVVEYSTGGFWDSFYEYEQVLFDRFDLMPSKDALGARQYYLLDM